MTAPLRRVAVRAPDPACGEESYREAGWTRVPDPVAATRQHAALVEVMVRAGVTVERLPPAARLADACFTYDPVMVTGRGAVVLRQAKPARAGESELLAAELEGLGVPVVGRLTGAARADGGDLYWLDEHTLAAGRGYRTNDEAHRQLRELLAEEGVRVVGFDMPHDRGPDECLHLMSVVSAVSEDLAVVYEPLAPVPLLEALDARGVRRVPVSPEEYDALGSNLLAVSPGHVVVLDGAPRVVDDLERLGVRVDVVEGSEFLPGTGGPTCLTRPLERG